MVSHGSIESVGDELVRAKAKARRVVCQYLTECANQGMAPEVGIGLLRGAVEVAGSFYRFVMDEHSAGRCDCE